MMISFIKGKKLFKPIQPCLNLTTSLKKKMLTTMSHLTLTNIKLNTTMTMDGQRLQLQ